MGVVMDITLNIVKVQNFDNTIVTIPPYSLVSGSFINWRGMTESGGRRIMREYALKLDYIQPCTPEFLEKMKKFDADLADFITEKQKQAAEGKVANTDNPAIGKWNHRYECRAASCLYDSLSEAPSFYQ